MSAAAAAAAAAANASRNNSRNTTTTSSTSQYSVNNHHHHHRLSLFPPPLRSPQLSRYEAQKRRDWIMFGQYLRNHQPPLALSLISESHVLEFLRYLDQFGKTKVHSSNCIFFGHLHQPAPCSCPVRQAWGTLDALVGRLRAAFEESGRRPEKNPFGERAVRMYLREVRDSQANARGTDYEKKKRKKPQQIQI